MNETSQVKAALENLVQMSMARESTGSILAAATAVFQHAPLAATTQVHHIHDHLPASDPSQTIPSTFEVIQTLRSNQAAVFGEQRTSAILAALQSSGLASTPTAPPTQGPSHALPSTLEVIQALRSHQATVSREQGTSAILAALQSSGLAAAPTAPPTQGPSHALPSRSEVTQALLSLEAPVSREKGTSAILAALQSSGLASTPTGATTQGQQIQNVLSSTSATPMPKVTSATDVIKALRSLRTPVQHSTLPVQNKPVEVIDLATLLAKETAQGHRPTVAGAFGHEAATNQGKWDFAPGKGETFPLKLYRMLLQSESAGLQDIVGFSPSGRAFYIRNVHAFEEKIMPQYFTSTRMATFQRQLNLYGFRCAVAGPDKGCYHHPHFIRGQPSLCKNISRMRKGQRPIAGKAPIQDDVLVSKGITSDSVARGLFEKVNTAPPATGNPVSSLLAGHASTQFQSQQRPGAISSNSLSPLVVGILQGVAASSKLRLPATGRATPPSQL